MRSNNPFISQYLVVCLSYQIHNFPFYERNIQISNIIYFYFFRVSKYDRNITGGFLIIGRYLSVLN